MTITTRLAELEARRRRLGTPSPRESPPEVGHAERVYAAELAAHGDGDRAVQAAERASVGARGWGDA